MAEPCRGKRGQLPPLPPIPFSYLFLIKKILCMVSVYIYIYIYIYIMRQLMGLRKELACPAVIFLILVLLETLLV
jgi:hypothetical protein